MKIYHYTTGDAIQQIEKEGFLRPSTVGVLMREKPIVWFSSDNFFERMCLPMNILNSSIMTVEQMSQRYGGLFRYGVDSTDEQMMLELAIQQWDILKITANLSKQRRGDLAVLARHRGTKTEHWYGTINDITSISRLTKERLAFDTGVAQWITQEKEKTWTSTQSVA